MDYKAKMGVCSCCPDQVERWNTSDRVVLNLMIVARITQEGNAEPFFLERNDMGSMPCLLGTETGRRFNVKWVKMPVKEFEALPQFEHVRLAVQWFKELTAAATELKKGHSAQSEIHRLEAERIDAVVTGMGFNVLDLIEK